MRCRQQIPMKNSQINMFHPAVCNNRILLLPMIEDPVVNKNLLYAKNGYRLHLNVIIFTQNRKIITFNSKNRAGQTKKQKNPIRD